RESQSGPVAKIARRSPRPRRVFVTPTASRRTADCQPAWRGLSLVFLPRAKSQPEIHFAKDGRNACEFLFKRAWDDPILMPYMKEQLEASSALSKLPRT